MTILTPTQVALYTSRLTEAETAYHNLTIGGQARVYVDQNGERVEFAVASSGRLRAYILELRGLLGLPIGVNGPANIWIL